ncbi:uncharacterized protein IUM83_19962 [Phytophthora cinnamomi]|uniref:uncharacterized protein n=1 Tax=Phytophthora cinnamomi TaxID=4785 RepID=UPI00355ABAFE|nr:hypothetical protein IUM83_19962 [Phytophthora cinnamomi]
MTLDDAEEMDKNEDTTEEYPDVDHKTSETVKMTAGAVSETDVHEMNELACSGGDRTSRSDMRLANDGVGLEKGAHGDDKSVAMVDATKDLRKAATVNSRALKVTSGASTVAKEATERMLESAVTTSEAAGRPSGMTTTELEPNDTGIDVGSVPPEGPMTEVARETKLSSRCTTAHMAVTRASLSLATTTDCKNESVATTRWSAEMNGGDMPYNLGDEPSMVYENGWHELVTEGRWTEETNSGDMPNELGDEPSVVNENGCHGFATESRWIQTVASTEDRTKAILAASGRAETTTAGMDGW